MKLAAGEYVALNKVELAIKMASVVENVCVYAESSKVRQEWGREE